MTFPESGKGERPYCFAPDVSPPIREEVGAGEHELAEPLSRMEVRADLRRITLTPCVSPKQDDSPEFALL